VLPRLVNQHRSAGLPPLNQGPIPGTLGPLIDTVFGGQIRTTNSHRCSWRQSRCGRGGFIPANLSTIRLGPRQLQHHECCAQHRADEQLRIRKNAGRGQIAPVDIRNIVTAFVSYTVCPGFPGRAAFLTKGWKGVNFLIRSRAGRPSTSWPVPNRKGTGEKKRDRVGGTWWATRSAGFSPTIREIRGHTINSRNRPLAFAFFL